MEMVSKVKGCVKGIDLHRPLPCWSLLWLFFADFFFTCKSRFLFIYLFLFLFFFKEPSKREGVRVLERESLG